MPHGRGAHGRAGVKPIPFHAPMQSISAGSTLRSADEVELGEKFSSGGGAADGG